ncbi:NUDIX hydrolase [Candidatus Jorgensenbacteria bacterium]|nr:NUDIX hydrolase [Candidatus Jorgensenbacteria bacterium]
MPEVEERKWHQLATTRCGPKSITVHVVVIYGEDVLIVKNKSKELPVQKRAPDGQMKKAMKEPWWGNPAGGVKENERPIDRAVMEVAEETNPKSYDRGQWYASIKAALKIDEHPVFVFQKPNSHYDIYFVGILDQLSADLPNMRCWEVEDLASGVTHAATMNPRKDIGKHLGQHVFRGTPIFNGSIQRIKHATGYPVT